MKHTPGPWHANTPLREEDCTDVTIREPKHGHLVATVAAGKANAKLIAAAPDLLDALTTIAKQFEIRGDDKRLLAIARAAIAKAKGE